MSHHTYRVTEIVGTSHEGINNAIRNSISRAAQTLRDLDWFEMTEVRGHIVDGESSTTRWVECFPLEDGM